MTGVEEGTKRNAITKEVINKRKNKDRLNIIRWDIYNSDFKVPGKTISTLWRFHYVFFLSGSNFFL